MMWNMNNHLSFATGFFILVLYLIGGSCHIMPVLGFGGKDISASPSNPYTIKLKNTNRDFKSSHPDFEKLIASEKGIVLPTLGSDGKPQYNISTTSITTHGKNLFDQWYNDIDGVNKRKDIFLTLTKVSDNPLTYAFSDPTFFPIDGELFGNEGNIHNYHFTTAIRSTFVSHGGEKLAFIGDDDVWVFVDKRLVVDFGGVHPAETQTVNLDSVATAIGITPSNTYDIDIFQAERHTIEAAFSMSIPV